MEQHLIEDAVWQRMLAALETVPYMPLSDLDRLRRSIGACFVVVRANLTWAELGGLVPSAEAAKKRFRRWARACSTGWWSARSLPLPRTCRTSTAPASSAAALRPAPAAAGTDASGAAAAG